MPEQVLTILKFCLLALVYLFFFRVLSAVWAEVSASKSAEIGNDRRGGARGGPPERGSIAVPAPAAPTAPIVTSAPLVAASAPRHPTQLVAREPAHIGGSVFPLDTAVTIGRDPSSTIVITQEFVSFHHARVLTNGVDVFAEDVGSTNGTFVNDVKISSLTAIHVGDIIRCGALVLEAQ